MGSCSLCPCYRPIGCKCRLFASTRHARAECVNALWYVVLLCPSLVQWKLLRERLVLDDHMWGCTRIWGLRGPHALLSCYCYAKLRWFIDITECVCPLCDFPTQPSLGGYAQSSLLWFKRFGPVGLWVSLHFLSWCMLNCEFPFTLRNIFPWPPDKAQNGQVTSPVTQPPQGDIHTTKTAKCLHCSNYSHLSSPMSTCNIFHSFFSVAFTKSFPISLGCPSSVQ